MDLWTECTGFNWNEGNVNKNWDKHGVADFECEEVFFNQPLIVRPDPKHSRHEARFYALGRTDSNRLLFVAFTGYDHCAPETVGQQTRYALPIPAQDVSCRASG